MNYRNVQAIPRRFAAALIPIWPLFTGLLFATSPVTAMSDPDVSALEVRVEQLTRQLEQAKEELATVRSRVADQNDEALPAPEAVATRPEDTPRGDITIGPVTVGGAVRVNYIYGSYEDSGSGPSRGGDGGNVELDTIRANLALDYREWIGELEYRWYNGYNFLHTGWLGYRLDEDSQVQVGVTRVPFGAGPYGVSQSWFFDQHYYMGLADDMDLGVKYVGQRGRWKLDLAYFVSSEGNWNGSSKDSARYSYDAVKWDSALDPDGNVVDGPLNGYAERNQLNVRAIYALEFDAWTADIGASLQYGQLDGKRADDGNAWAAAVHMVSEFGNWLLGAQLTRYRIDIDDDNLLGTDELIPLGAYDFAWPVATDTWIPAVSFSYRYETPRIGWLDYVRPYAEYSNIIKRNGDFNDSQLVTIGAAWANGGWYIYTEVAYSDGNLFVGDDDDDYSNIFRGVGDFGANGNDKWNHRFNINFGYYF